MRLATYKFGGTTQIGFAIGGQLIPLDEAYGAAGLGAAPSNMLALIGRNAETRDNDLKKAYAAAEKLSGAAQSAVEFLPPVRGYKILSTAINNSGVSRLASVCPQKPVFFLKPTSCLIGHGQKIVIRPDYGLTHPEAELAIVIGQHAKHLTQENALDAVFGYTIINDITSITLKSEDTYVFPAPSEGPVQLGFEWGDMQLTYHARSKGTDTFGPIGPWIVTKEELPDPNRLAVNVFMGDEHVTADNTANLRYTVQDILVWASRFFTLECGDIIHIGTAAAGRYGLRELDLQVWDGPLAVEIEGIGRITNPIERIDLNGNLVPAKTPGPKNIWPPRYAAEQR
jgi:2-keto-4-pentenoate hydratase/2-oxohepta-3-ene-1,7-dioic acid hydratase in catechol pathway